jgi:hypothetical protein
VDSHSAIFLGLESNPVWEGEMPMWFGIGLVLGLAVGGVTGFSFAAIGVAAAGRHRRTA